MLTSSHWEQFPMDTFSSLDIEELVSRHIIFVYWLYLSLNVISSLYGWFACVCTHANFVHQHINSVVQCIDTKNKVTLFIIDTFDMKYTFIFITGIGHPLLYQSICGVYSHMFQWLICLTVFWCYPHYRPLCNSITIHYIIYPFYFFDQQDSFVSFCFNKHA